MADDVSRVLIVEDNLLVAMDEQIMVEQCGCIVLGPVGTVYEALALIAENSLDGAVLDVDLGGERVWPVTDRLEARNVPFVLATGYTREEVPERFRERPMLTKPVTLDALRRMLGRLGLIP